MPPISRRLLASTIHAAAEAPLPVIVRAPIGWVKPLEPVGRRTLQLSARGGVRASRVQQRSVDGRRWQSSWEKQHPAPASQPKRSDTKPLLGAVIGASALAYLGSKFTSQHSEQGETNVHSDGVDLEGPNDDDEKIRLSEVLTHDRNSDRQWVIRNSSVYDVTDFIEQHPGGEVILRACGGSIDPYWKIFTIHQKQEVYDILQEYYIGDIDQRDLDEEGKVNWTILGEDAQKAVVDDPFKHDPERDSSLIFRTEKPCNAETPGNMLIDFLTPLRLFFSITIELSDGEEISYSLEDLKSKFKAHTITATLQCAGNRRSHMSKGAQGPTSGLQWDVGAIGTADFTGVRLRDVLRDSGYGVEDDCATPTQCASEEQDKHVHFISPGDTYAASIPLQTAVNPQADVLLAWDMNGEPLNRDHGGPIRAIVPGTTAARSVKWLGRISISTDESPSQWQQRDYKCFGPNMKQAQCQAEDWEAAQAIQETPVQSVITNVLPANGDNKTTVQGFAFSGGGRRIVRVDVSADGGKTWKQAELKADKAKGSRRWAWTLWTISWPKDELRPEGKDVEFVVKASDDAYNTQPHSFDSTWNFRGLLANAWHREKKSLEEL